MVRLLSIAAAVGIGAFTVIAQDLKDVDPSVIAKDHNTVLYVKNNTHGIKVSILTSAI